MPYVLRPMSLLKGNQARSLPGCDTAMGQRIIYFCEYSGRVEEIRLPEDGPIELGADISVADAEWAEQGARRAGFQTGLTTAHAVVWKNGRSWAGRKSHMGYFQEAYDAECAAIARVLAEAVERAKRRKLGRVRIFTDAQAVIKRIDARRTRP